MSPSKKKRTIEGPGLVPLMIWIFDPILSKRKMSRLKRVLMMLLRIFIVILVFFIMRMVMLNSFYLV